MHWQDEPRAYAKQKLTDKQSFLQHACRIKECIPLQKTFEG